MSASPAAVGSITAGAATTTKTIALIAGNAVTTGALTSGTTASDYVFISNPSIFTADPNFDAAGPPAGFDFSPYVVLTPQPIAGAITINGAVTTGNFRVATARTLTVTGAINASASYFARANALVLGDLTVGGAIDLLSATTITAGNVRGELDVNVAANGDIVLGNVSAGDSIAINPATGQTASTTATVRTGALDAGLLRPSTDPQAGYQILVRAPGNVSTGSIGARGGVTLFSTGGSVGAGSIATQRSLLLLASNAASTGAITTAATGVSYVGNISAFTAQQLGALNPLGAPAGFDLAALTVVAPTRVGGTITVGSVDTGTFQAASAGAFSAGAIRSAQSITINTAALASFSGIADAPLITVRSGDIAIGQGGGLGSAATTLLTLQIDPTASGVTIGDAPAQQGWTLDNAEAGRLRARRTLIQTATTQTQTTVRIGTLALTGSAGTNPNLIGQTASFEVATGAPIRVVGAVTIANAAATDTLKLTAGSRLDVLTDQGGALTLTGAGGSVAGTLSLAGRDIFVGTAALASQLIANPAFTGRNDALGAVPTTANLAGNIGANTIQVSSTSGGTVLIQNTGSRTQRAGFTAGTGGFTVTAPQTTQTQTATPVDVVINGRIFDTNGTALINGNTVQRVTLTSGQQSGGFTATSSVNGCVIGSTCLVFGGFPGTPDQDPIEAVVEDIATNAEVISDDDKRKIEAAQQAAAQEVPQVRIEKLISARPVIADPTVDEPVTSGGNSSLWGSPPEPLTTGPGEH